MTQLCRGFVQKCQDSKCELYGSLSDIKRGDTMKKAKILVVEDQNIVALNIRNKLKNLGYTVPGTASTGEEAIRKAELTNADLVLMAMGFVHCVHEGIIKEFELELDPRGNIKVGTDFQTSGRKVFAAGDAVTGASLVVRAIRQGRVLAKAVDKFLCQA